MPASDFFLGGAIDDAGQRSDAAVAYDGAHLTTHGVIVGMTGSGKTGLGIIFLEEALRSGVPALIIDPKGDMTNLLLTFPDLAPADFEPWLDPAEVSASGKAATDVAAEKAETWRSGLDSWGLGGDDIRALKEGAGFTIYTPGSRAGVPVNIVGSLANPGLDWDSDAETLREEIQGFASGLLGLIGVEADPVSSREHILIANLVENSWRQGADLDLATLLGQIQAPPMRKMGVFDVDTFFPEKDRVALAMKLNGLLASASFAEWVAGAPLDVGAMLRDADGRPQAAIVYLAHLSDEERQFIVTLLLSKVITWMRRQSGTGDLRALVYMDEVFGFVPPTANPPAKLPILTVMKQGRAFGVGMLLSTQNPVDLDYKSMSNAGTWCIGRLQTDRDKARILEALQSASGERDISALDATISGLGKRQFVLHDTSEPVPTLFTTRWAMSYLAGPLTRNQLTALKPDAPAPTAPEDAAPGSPAEVPPAEPAATEQPADTPQPTPTAPALGDDETPVMPSVAAGVPVRWLHPSAPWAAPAGATPGATTHVPAQAARVNLLYDDTAADLVHTEEWEAIIPIGDSGPDLAGLVNVDYDDRDLTDAAPPGAAYRIVGAKLDDKRLYTDAERALVEHLYRTLTLTLQRNTALKLWSRPGESPEDFTTRCDAAAQEKADAETAKLRDRYTAKIDAARKRFEASDRRVKELEVDVSGSQRDELLSGAEVLLDIFTGKKSTRSATGSMRKRQQTASRQQRLESAKSKAMAEWEEMAGLEAELTADLEEINDRWEALVDETEDVAIRLEKNDVSVAGLVLLWLPVT